jgi:hypothetical protein
MFALVKTLCMKRKTFLQYAIVCSLPLAFSSCYYSAPLPFDIPLEWQKENLYYTPHTANAPLLKKKNDLSASFNYGVGKEYAESELRVAYMPAAHVGITTNVALSSNVGRVKFVKPEIAVGYIKPLSKNWQFETYAGVAGANIENEHSTGWSHVKNTQLFIQPAVSLHNTTNTAEIGLVSRFARVNFKVMDTTFSSRRETYCSISTMRRLLILAKSSSQKPMIIYP